ncbi:hypothetical protein DUZ99_16620 [Xylanibacillus composti]|uniref:HEPN domain-containing protein n=1 Tax=Xylanibacillus composti TaxID=1572762 RepID=A0A8J4H3L2_9BACL|nr:hypothetical protein [Xylanibacillus composti]MDT9726603.1 hypothetical protein [Xylanibacillus composti]GIQ69025.1 hypothetical protein XYCOK13_18490 [Xylanibacillus composti]
MTELKWPHANPDFYRIISPDNIVRIKATTNLSQDFFIYAEMFRKAAHVLTEHILRKASIRELDTYFYSVTYLYRHSLELMLKAIGFKFITDVDERKRFIKNTFHNPSKILATIKQYLNKEINNNEGLFDWTEKFLSDLSKVDKESDSFRYPFGIIITRENPFSEKQYSLKLLFEKQTHINLLALANKMEIAYTVVTSYYNDSELILEEYNNYTPSFLEEGGSYYAQSVVGYGYNKGKFYPYVSAFKESADYLFEFMTDNRQLKEFLFLPMCYLYRNAIELALKEILFEECSFGFLNGLKLIKDRKHSIQRLWNTILNDVKSHNNASDDDPTIQNVEKYIIQLQGLDSTSDKFRYPTNKLLEPHFKEIKCFDIQNVSTFFGELASFLNGVCLQMSHHNELMAELRAEYEAGTRWNYE